MTRALSARLSIQQLLMHVTWSCLRIRQIRCHPALLACNYVESYRFVLQCFYSSIQLSGKVELILLTASF
jgi:hypothetical protein